MNLKQCPAVVKHPALSVLSFILLCLLLAAPTLAAPRKVTIDPAGSLLLPEGWTVMDPGAAAKEVAGAKERMGINVSSNTAFFAVKNNPTQGQPACIVLERAQASPLNNNIIPILTPEEKEETIADIIDTMNEKQQTVLYSLIGQAIEDTNNKDPEGGEEMKHNLFEGEVSEENKTSLVAFF